MPSDSPGSKSSVSLELPRFIAGSLDGGLDQERLRRAQELVDQLALQTMAFKIAAIFERFGNTRAILFRLDTNFTLRQASFERINEKEPRDKSGVSETERAYYVLDELVKQAPASALKSLQDRKIERPPEGSSLSLGVLRQALGADAFAQWEKAQLACASPSEAPAPRPSKPSL